MTTPGVPVSRPFVGIGVPLVIRFGPADVGRRVTLRRRLLDAPPEGPSLGDVVGVLERWSAGSLTLRRRTGETVDVPLLTVVAGRVVAPEVSAEDLSRRAHDTWRAGEVEPLGDWLLRAHSGATHRANSVLAIGEPGTSLPAAAEAVRRWYAARDLAPHVMTPLPSSVADGLVAMGWREEHRSAVLSTPLPDLVGAAVADDDVVLSDTLPADWPDVLAVLRGEHGDRVRELLTATPSAVFATARGGDGHPVGVTRGGVSDGWLNLTNVEVLERARGRRLAVGLIGAVARVAADRGATHAFLQVRLDNTAARRLYERLGFTTHHEYAYLVEH